MIGMSASMKCNYIAKIFDQAYKSPLSIIILDDIERIIEYISEGPRFSNIILQTLLVLIKKEPDSDKKLMIIGTTSIKKKLFELDINEGYNDIIHIPVLSKENVKSIIKHIDCNETVTNIIGDKTDIDIKKLLFKIEML